VNSDQGCGSLFTAEAWAAQRKRPPNSPNVALAKQQLQKQTEQDEPMEDDTTTVNATDGATGSDEDADILTNAQVANMKALLPHATVGPAAQEALRKHAKAVAEKERRGFVTKAGAVSVVGKSYSHAVLMHERMLISAQQERADFELKRAKEVETRREQTDKARKDFQAQVEHAKRELQRFEQKAADEECAWTASYQEGDVRLAAKVTAAQEAVEKAKRDCETHGPNAIIPAPAGDGGADASTGNGAAPAEARPAKQASADAATLKQVVPFTPLPVVNPTDDALLIQKLAGARDVIQLWWVQEAEWPLSPATLGLTLEHCAQLLGPQNWAAAACTSVAAPLSRSTIGKLSVALTKLEVSTAMAQASQATQQQLQQQQQQAEEALRTGKLRKLAQGEATASVMEVDAEKPPGGAYLDQDV
jgi:hypothetical protein